MIIEIKVANYRSINEEQTLSFVADRATRHPNNLIKRPGYRLLKAIGMFGANASGKSNFVKAIGAMSTFVRDSATRMNYDDPIEPAEPYRLDPATRDKPSRFEITFVTDGTVYTYGFAATNERVHEEWISAKIETSEKEILHFDRTLDAESGQAIWLFSPQLKPLTELFLERTRPNGLALSLAARENVKELLPAYHYISNSLQIIDMSFHANTLLIMTAHDCISNPYHKQEVEDLLRDADAGVHSIRTEYERLDNPAYVTLPSGTVSRQAPRLNVNYSELASDGTPVEFDLMRSGSTGTQRLYGLAGLWIKTLKSGKFIAIDELDASMHPLLTRKLLELFQSPAANPNGAQLLFTTHDAVMLDTVLFRRDQIVLAEKCDNASRFYSLAEMVPPIRNTESYLRNYLAGRYGGTPYFGRAFEDVAVGSKA